MKTTIIFHENIKQIIFTPENDTEKQALKMISPDDNIELAVRRGSFMSKETVPQGFEVDKCRGGYLRAWNSNDSIMLVLTPKQKEAP